MYSAEDEDRIIAEDKERSRRNLARLREKQSLDHIVDGRVHTLNMWSTNNYYALAEAILRERYGLVREDRSMFNRGRTIRERLSSLDLAIVKWISSKKSDPSSEMLVLVYERDGPGTGLYRVHFNVHKEGELLLTFRYWAKQRGTGEQMPEECFRGDPMRIAMEEVYAAIRPSKVTGIYSDIEVQVPWVKAYSKAA